MLDPVSQLAQHRVGDVLGVLGDEVDPHPLGAHQPDHLLDFLQQDFRRFVEEQVGLVEEEDQLGPVQVSRLGEPLKEFGEEPQEEGGVELGRLDESVRRQDVDDPPAGRVPGDEIPDVQSGLPEEELPSLVLQAQEGPLDGPDADCGNGAVLQHVVLGVFRHMLQHRPEVLQIQKKEPLVIGDPEHHRQDALLGRVQTQEPGQQKGAHVRDGGPHRVALTAVEVPEDRREALEVGGRKTQPGEPFGEFGARAAPGGYPRDIPLDVGQENRDPRGAAPLRQHLHRHGLPRPRCPCDEAVTVHHCRGYAQFPRSPGDFQESFHDRFTPLVPPVSLNADSIASPNRSVFSSRASSISLGSVPNPSRSSPYPSSIR
ncbi:MAG: hypothetical protein BWY71_01641 [Planctomycetes bacterium ADurb.Bin412]|nr:MAG: hypothetical protein BWY71_01641 [Planctomycetes bacterium ADurb.Bin412]